MLEGLYINSKKYNDNQEIRHELSIFSIISKLKGTIILAESVEWDSPFSFFWSNYKNHIGKYVKKL